MAQPQLTYEGPLTDEIRIIGVELAAQRNNNREVELDMFRAAHTMRYDNYDNTRLRITVHTSNGDVTVGFPLRPGNYQSY